MTPPMAGARADLPEHAHHNDLRTNGSVDQGAAGHGRAAGQPAARLLVPRTPPPSLTVTRLSRMRLGHRRPDGVAFVSIEGAVATPSRGRSKNTLRHAHLHRTLLAAGRYATAGADPGHQSGVHGQELRRPHPGDGGEAPEDPSSSCPTPRSSARNVDSTARQRFTGAPRRGTRRRDRPAV